MKKLIIGTAALLVGLAAYGQGTVTINNRIGTEVTARFMLATDAAGTSSVGSPGYTVNFLGGPVGGTLVPLTPSSSTMRGAAGTASAGYFTGVTATVPGVPPGGTASVRVDLVGPNGTTSYGP